jgi:hypothetical protein
MPDRSKGRGQMKCNPWSSRLGVVHGANNPIQKKCTAMKPPEKGGPWRRPQGCSASKEEDNLLQMKNVTVQNIDLFPI